MRTGRCTWRRRQLTAAALHGKEGRVYRPLHKENKLFNAITFLFLLKLLRAHSVIVARF